MFINSSEDLIVQNFIKDKEKDNDIIDEFFNYLQFHSYNDINGFNKGILEL